ncbi:MAG: hypothetical protein MZW92_54945 [Comamonadaceae bacterium]|nr:hypothetical protein [Comamonadaceae bacterium]
MVAQELVARRPEHVSALVLAGTSPAFGTPDGAWQAASSSRSASRRSTPAWAWPSWRRSWCRRWPAATPRPTRVRRGAAR